MASGIFTVIDVEQLSAATDSKKVAAFLNIGQQDYEYPIISKGQCLDIDDSGGAHHSLAYVALPPKRLSRNELLLLAKNDPKLKGKAIANFEYTFTNVGQNCSATGIARKRIPNRERRNLRSQQSHGSLHPALSTKATLPAQSTLLLMNLIIRMMSLPSHPRCRLSVLTLP